MTRMVDVLYTKAYTEGDKIILEPMAEIPAHELWLYKTPQALEDVQEGLQQSKEGRVRKRGTFAAYAKDDVCCQLRLMDRAQYEKGRELLVHIVNMLTKLAKVSE